MIEATIIFKEGVQTHLTLNVTFEDVEDGEIETLSKMGFIEFNGIDRKIPSYMHILGRMLKNRAKSFWDNGEVFDREITDLKLWSSGEDENMFEEKEDDKDD